MTRSRSKLLAWRPGRLAWNTVHAGGWSGLRIGLQAGSLILLARLFGADGYGAISGTVGFYITLAQLVGLGTGISFFRHTVRSGGLAKLGATQAVYLVTGIGFFLVAWPVSLVLLPDSHLDSATLAIFAFAELVIAPCLMPLAYRYQAAERMSVAGALLTTAPIARFVAILIAMLLGNASLRVFAWLYLGCLLFAAASAVQMLWPRKETGFPRPSISAEIREGLPFAVTNAAATAGGELDKTVMLRYAGDLLTGHYSAASRVAQAAILPVNALMVAAAPRWFRTTRPKQVLSGSGSLFAAAFGYSIIASCAIWLFSPYLPLLLGDDFSSSVSILRFMSVAVVTGSIRQIFGMLLTSSDLQRARNWIEIVAVLSGLALMPFAIPRLGAAGAVLCLVATDVSLIGMGWYVLHLHDKRHADGGA